jgi:hypothetical protein
MRTASIHRTEQGEISLTIKDTMVKGTVFIQANSIKDALDQSLIFLGFKNGTIDYPPYCNTGVSEPTNRG